MTASSNLDKLAPNFELARQPVYLFYKRNASAKTPPTQGSLNLRLAGFSQQDIVPIDDIVRSIDLLPSFHLEGLREIVYAPEWMPAPSYDVYSSPFRSAPKAEFVQRERRIIIYDFDTSALFFQILFHEIGHFVFFLIISSVVKKRWVTGIYPGSQCITAYGSASAAEDFAETYACYMRDPDFLMRQLPEKHAFMLDYVFSGTPDTLKELVERQT